MKIKRNERISYLKWSQLFSRKCATLAEECNIDQIYAMNMNRKKLGAAIGRKSYAFSQMFLRLPNN